ncbi:hypothetical protein [Dactylosporangium sp. CA-139066]|uniref:hypothetical protein n=1 Tax=Dactylosporangium sp. CA-139066 TaxID=3239930 RepID=UPI003D8FA9D7
MSQPVYPFQPQEPHVTAEVRPAVAPPQFDLENSLSRAAAPQLPWQQAAPPVSAPPVSGPPVSAPPVSAPPVSAPPVSGPPVSAPPVSVPPVLAPPPMPARPNGPGPLSATLPALHVGWHDIGAETLGAVRGGMGPAGLIVGVDYQRRPVPIRLFRPAPTRVTLVGGLWVQRILVFRALALGARVIVMTADPRPWQGLGEWATGSNDRLVLWNDPRPPAAPASARQPLLIVAAAGTPTRLGAWQTQLAVVPHLAPEHTHALQGGDLVMLQQLSPPEAAVAAAALNLPENGAGPLQEMTPDMLALMGGGANRYVWVAPTGIERQYHGQPAR